MTKHQILYRRLQLFKVYINTNSFKKDVYESKVCRNLPKYVPAFYRTMFFYQKKISNNFIQNDGNIVCVLIFFFYH